MTLSHVEEKSDGTFRQLFDTIECSTNTDRLQTLLAEKTNQLALGLDFFTEPSSSARSKLTSDKPISLDSHHTCTLTSDEKDLVCHFSDCLQLNELQCTLLWQAFRQRHPTLVADILQQRREQQQQQKHHIVQQCPAYDHVFQLFTRLYYQDRLSLLHAMSSLLRLCQQPTHPYYTLASDSVKSFVVPDQLLTQFSRLVRKMIPPAFMAPTLMHEYAQQLLKEEKAILEILMVYYMTRPCPASVILSLYQEFEANGFGTEQTFGHALNASGRQLRTEVSYLCVLFAVQVLQQQTIVTHEEENNNNNHDTVDLKSSPSTIVALNDVIAFLGDIKEHALPLLAWADFLSTMEAIINEKNDNSNNNNNNNNSNNNDDSKIKEILTGDYSVDRTHLLSSKDRPRQIYNNRASSTIPTNLRTPLIEQGPNLYERCIGRAIKLEGFNYIHNLLAMSQVCKDEDVNRFGYHMIVYELLYRFAFAVRLDCLQEQVHSTVIQDFCLLFRNQPELCYSFWYGRQIAIEQEEEQQERDTMDTDDGQQEQQQTHSALATLLLEPNSGRFPRTFTDIVQLLTAVCGDASTQHNAASLPSPIQCVFEYLTPGWRDLVNKLVLFLHRDDSAGSAEVNAVLHLLEKALSLSDGTLVTRLVEMVDVDLPTQMDIQPEQPYLLTILCEMVARSSTVQDCAVDRLTLTIKSLTALLPFYPVALWTFISTSSLFPRPLEKDPLLALSFSKVPTRSLGQAAQIDRVINAVECEIGRYSILLALLDLIDGLVKDVRRNGSSPSDGVDEQYKAEVLSGYFHYLMTHVLSDYSNWRYKSVHERYLIGSKMMNIFVQVERYFKFEHDEQDSKNNGGTIKVSTISRVREAMLHRFLKDDYSSQFYLSPLLNVMASGAWTADKLFKANRYGDAQQAETLTRLTFIFVKSLLQQRNSTGLLEKAMLHHRYGINGKMDFLYRLAILIQYHSKNDSNDRRHRDHIRILATNVLSLLCVSVSRWQVVPNFVQYLGDTDQVQDVIRSYLATAKDASQPESLLTSVWQMITLLVETQPSLALLFMECGDAIMPSPKTAVKLLDNQQRMQQQQQQQQSQHSSTESAVRAAVDLLVDWQTLSIEKPTVLSKVLLFLTTFWQTAFDHYALVQRTRSDNALWQALEAILFNPDEDDSNKMDQTSSSSRGTILATASVAVEAQEEMQIDSELDKISPLMRRQCCMHLSRAFIMRLIAFEIHLTAGSQVAQGIKQAVVGDKLPAGLKNLIIKMGEPKKLEWMRSRFICTQLLTNMCEADRNWALVDAEALLLQSFKMLMETSSGHVPELIWHAKNKTTLYTFILDLIEQLFKDDQDVSARQQEQQQQQQLQQEKRKEKQQQLQQQREEGKNGVALTNRQQVALLIRALVEDWVVEQCKADNAVVQKESLQNSMALVMKLCQLLERENFALLQTIGATPVTYHRPLLECLLLCIRTVTTDDASTQPQLTAHSAETTTLTSLMRVICSSFSSVVQHTLAQQKTNAPDDVVEECMKDVTVVLALLGELIKKKDKLPPSLWLPIFEEQNTIPMLLKLANRGMILLMHEMESQIKSEGSHLYNIMVSPYAENSLYFMIALSNIPEAAKALRIHGVMDLLCNNALSKQLEFGKLDVFVRFGDKANVDTTSTTTTTATTTTATTTTQPTATANAATTGGTTNTSQTETQTSSTTTIANSSLPHNDDSNQNSVLLKADTLGGFIERSPLHVLWCQMLQIISNMIRQVQDPTLLRHCVLFMQKYGNQVDRSFAIANGANDSLLGVLPSEALSSPLMTEIEWLTTIFFGLAKQGAKCDPLFIAFKNCGLPLVKRYHYYANHPKHMQAQLFPVDQQEKLQLQTPYSTDNDTYTSQLMYSTTQRADRITRNLLASIIVLAEQQ